MKVMNYTGFMTISFVRVSQGKKRIRPGSKDKHEVALESERLPVQQPVELAAPRNFRSRKTRKTRKIGRFTDRTTRILAKLGETGIDTKGFFNSRKFGRTIAKLSLQRFVKGLLVARGFTVIDQDSLRLLIQQEVTRILSVETPPVQSAAMTSARARGAVYSRQQYESPENLSLQDAAKHTGFSDRLINTRRNAGRYYALLLDGNSRGFRYPAWQFDAQPERLASVLDVLLEAQASCWAIHNFMLGAHVQLDGMSPREWILDRARDIGRVVNLARGRFLSDQGAG